LTDYITDIDNEGTTITVSVKSSSQMGERSPFQLFDRTTGVLGGNINFSGWTSDLTEQNTSYPYKQNSGGALYPSSGEYFVEQDYRGEYVMIDMGEPAYIIQMRLWCNISISETRGRHPRNYRLYGTNDVADFDNEQSENWTQIFDKIDTTPLSTPRSNPTIDNFVNTQSFRYYALVINSIYNRETDDLVELFEIELFEYSPYDIQFATENDLQNYQPLLTAGANISIAENAAEGTLEISATDTDTTYTASTGISISAKKCNILYRSKYRHRYNLYSRCWYQYKCGK